MDIFRRSALTFSFVCCLLLTSLSDATARTQGLTQNSAQNPTLGELEFPYTAIVLANETEIRSGPGKTHYATMEVSKGKTVEVYRHDPGGWCAIRPPAESFSLIPAEALKLVGPGVGQVLEDGTQAWVGTSLGPVDHPLWQLKLKRGETVAVLGELSWPNPEGHSTIWYQVRPPAGEFRWIKMADLQLPPSKNPRSLLDQLPVSNTKNNSDFDGVDRNVKQVNLQTPIDAQKIWGTRNAAFDSEVTMNAPRTGGWKRASRPLPQATANHLGSRRSASVDNERGSFSNRASSSDSGGYLGAFAQPGAGSFGSRSDQYQERFASRDSMSSQLRSLNDSPRSVSNFDRSSSSSTSNISNVSERVANLELELSHEMLKHPEKWNLVVLKSKTEAIVESTNQPNERLDAQKLLDKLNQCQQLHQGYASSGTLAQTGTGRPFAGSTGIGNVGSVGSAGSAGNDIGMATMYDAYGWLAELVQGGGSLNPTYVLQDDSGRITHHVTGGPGLNLNRYLKAKVGVFGRRGYNSRLQLNHVTVERVVVVKTR